MTKADLMKIVSVFTLFFAFASAASGQQRSGFESVETDSAHRVVILDPGIALGRPILLFPSPLERDSLFVTPSFLMLGEIPAVAEPLIVGNFEQRVDLLSPLRLQMEKESGFRSLQAVLGTVELAGVGYLAYRHIKKYGFLR